MKNRKNYENKKCQDAMVLGFQLQGDLDDTTTSSVICPSRPTESKDSLRCGKATRSSVWQMGKAKKAVVKAGAAAADDAPAPREPIKVSSLYDANGLRRTLDDCVMEVRERWLAHRSSTARA